LSPVQVLPHEPQLFLSFEGLMQLELQQVWPDVHDAPHALQLALLERVSTQLPSQHV
jgi:hypothetical protein